MQIKCPEADTAHGEQAAAFLLCLDHNVPFVLDRNVFPPHTMSEVPKGQGSAPQVLCSRRESR